MTQVQLAAETLNPRPESNGAVEPAEIVSQIAHELRQPLSTIESIAYYLDLVLPKEQPKIRQQLAKLQQLVDHSNWIVSNAVYVTQAALPSPEPVDVRNLLSECIADCIFSGANIQLRLSQALPPVWLDPAQGKHLVRTLIQFFRGASDSERAIVVATSATHGDVLVEFACSGRSSRSEEALLESLPSGSGFSLASVRRIVNAHGGRFRIVADSGLGISALVAFPAAELP